MSIENPRDAGLSRRNMLMKLGLAVTVAYVAPVMLKLDEAHASSGGSGGSGGRGSGGRGGGGHARGGSGGSFSGFRGRRSAARSNNGRRRRAGRSFS